MKQILVLHGALSSQSVMSKLTFALSINNEVYSFDFPGHGGKELVNNKIRMNDLAQSIVDFCFHLQIYRPLIFGYSMGGYAALVAVARLGFEVEKIITLGTKFNWSKEALDKELKKLDPELMLQKAPQYIEYLQGLHQAQDWEILIHNTADMMKNLCEEQQLTSSEFEKINCPVHLLLGEQDKMVSREETEISSSKIKNSKIEILPDTKHPMEQVNVELLHGVINKIIE